MVLISKVRNLHFLNREHFATQKNAKDRVSVETALFNEHTEYIMCVKRCQYVINRQDYVTRKTTIQMATTLGGVIT
jgi:hypothetical protein